ncbi:hypothetical protein MSAN_01808900 [Mycena sanguinolenta]|uniref:Uncharacterized protein n=1 Tax=Mycena sanguinolenta TaxID=230812 RepID=A0A8H6XRI3_9AGAR|nr:hypothetical protein MSAN_01808900 [Mycena sanguinolenta]
MHGAGCRFLADSHCSTCPRPSQPHTPMPTSASISDAVRGTHYSDYTPASTTNALLHALVLPLALSSAVRRVRYRARLLPLCDAKVCVHLRRCRARLRRTLPPLMLYSISASCGYGSMRRSWSSCSTTSIPAGEVMLSVAQFRQEEAVFSAGMDGGIGETWLGEMSANAPVGVQKGVYDGEGRVASTCDSGLTPRASDPSPVLSLTTNPVLLPLEVACRVSWTTRRSTVHATSFRRCHVAYALAEVVRDALGSDRCPPPSPPPLPPLLQGIAWLRRHQRRGEAADTQGYGRLVPAAPRPDPAMHDGKVMRAEVSPARRHLGLWGRWGDGTARSTSRCAGDMGSGSGRRGGRGASWAGGATTRGWRRVGAPRGGAVDVDAGTTLEVRDAGGLWIRSQFRYESTVSTPTSLPSSPHRAQGPPRPQPSDPTSTHPDNAPPTRHRRPSLFRCHCPPSAAAASATTPTMTGKLSDSAMHALAAAAVVVQLREEGMSFRCGGMGLRANRRDRRGAGLGACLIHVFPLRAGGERRMGQ